ncbi:hypothetical protein BDN71DRAFT_284014 [Pleurotus eryngii]|uniref:Uncharacterized protein n=1 Tax=Pleurotus eryngii TaxID=5323 RepID=A0A9P5ZK28_PLEER|nr:hypothetical protein BDN71DRAFT_284014 [Pleurotus eryngii]
MAPYVADIRVGDPRIWRDDEECKTWAAEGVRHAAGENPDLLAVIGRVKVQRHQLGVLGSYTHENDDLANAKWSFTLERPGHGAFADHFDNAYRALEEAQASASRTGDNRNLLSNDEQGRAIRFVKPMFVDKRATGVEEHGDVLTWPVPRSSANRFSGMMMNMRFSPLQVFHESGFAVAPVDMATRLPGTLAEVTFSLHHTHWQHLDCDTFSALVSKVVMLEDD